MQSCVRDKKGLLGKQDHNSHQLQLTTMSKEKSVSILEGPGVL